MTYYWLTINILLGILALGIRLSQVVFSSSVDRALAERILIFSFPMVFILPMFPKISFYEPPPVRWINTVHDLKIKNKPEKIFSGSPVEKQLMAKKQAQTPIASVRKMDFVQVLKGIIIINFFYWFCLFGKNILQLIYLVRSAAYSRKFGRVQLLYVEKAISPLSFWLPGRFVIIIPTWLLDNYKLYTIAIKHEFTHHRLGHSYFIWGINVLQSVFSINPAYSYIRNIVTDHMEYHCDQHTSLSLGLRAYAKGLVKVVDKLQCEGPSIALSMSNNKNQIKRRITMLKNLQHGKTSGRYFSAKLGPLVGALFIACAAICQTSAANNLAVSKYETIIERINTKSPQSEIKLELNKVVLKYLGNYNNTPQGFDFVMRSKSYLAGQEQFLVKALVSKQLPPELIAIPFIESSFRDVQQRSHNNLSLGLWQLTAETARQYGLTVNDTVDERYDVAKSTIAATKYFQHLLSIPKFNHDWRLVVLSYNAGEGKVIEAMQRLGTNDPWALDVGDKDYLAQFMAALIMLKSPALMSLKHPLSDGELTSSYGPRKSIFTKSGSHFHSGIDLASPSGSIVKSSQSGEVIKVQDDETLGKTIIIKHSANINTQYSHLQQVNVTEGQAVGAGEAIGSVGSTGDSTGSHLHFEVQVNAKAVNPLLYLSAYDVFGKN